ncbi:MAG: ABC transporter ATP-binding protein [Actinomycetota bacterium]
MSMQGVAGEDKIELSKEESLAVKLRARKLLFSLIYPVRLRLILSFAIVVVSQALRVTGPALIALGIDWALPQAMKSETTPLFLVVGGYLFAAVATASLISWFMRYAARINQDVLLDLRQRIFVHTQKLSLEFHEKYTSGRVISRQTSDLDAIKELLDSGGNEMIAGILYMLFTATALVLLDAPSFGVLVISWIPLYFLTRWFQVRSKLMFRESRVASAKLIVHFVETMTGIRAVKAFRKEKRNQKDYGVLVENYRDINAKVIQLFGIYDPGLIFIGNIAVAAILLFGGARVLDGSLGLGVLTAAILYARRFFDPMEDLAMFYNSYQSANSSLEKISGVLEERPSVPEASNPKKLTEPKGELVFDAIAFHYSNGVEVIPKLELRVPAGQTVALVGTTGAGKSTIAKLISRFYDPTGGSLRLDGIDLREISSKDLRKAVVMVTQEAYLFSGSVADNIALGKPDATPDEIEAAAKAVGAHEFIMGLPDGYSTDVNKRGGRVSAGQRQLISFVRAFIANPAVLILDEATSSLDVPSERLVQYGLRTLLRGRTAIIIAHRLSTVAIADRVLVLEHGKVLEDGSPKELIAGTGKFAKMHAAWRNSLV